MARSLGLSLVLLSLLSAVPSATAKDHFHHPNHAHIIKMPRAGAKTVAPYAIPAPAAQNSGPLLKPISTSAAPSSLFGNGVAHPRPPVNVANPANEGRPIGTNKWYNQLMLVSGTDPIYPLPYAIAYLNGTSLLSGSSNGMVGVGVMHSAIADRTYGPDPSANPVQYYTNPLTVAVSIGASEITAANVKMVVTGYTELTATINLSPGAAPSASSTTTRISVPLVRGGAYITALYSNLTPVFRSGLAITSVKASSKLVNGFTKTRVQYNDGSTWFIYSSPKPNSGLPALALVQNGQTELKSTQGTWTGVVQVVKMSTSWVSGGKEEAVYDAGVGSWVTGGTVTTGDAGSGDYGFKWTTDGPRSETAPLIFALPHHIASLKSPSPLSPKITLPSRSTGMMTLLASKTWSFGEKSSVSTVAKFSIEPVNPTLSKQTAPTAADLKALREIAVAELATNFTAEADIPFYYFSGKKLAKQAFQCLTISSILKDAKLAAQCSAKAQASLLMFVRGKQSAYPLVYDKTWRGIISSAFIKTGNEYDDFGNSVYNDHHFHWGYFVHTAAALSSLDSSLIAKVAPYINTMIRDVNNPSTEDTHFPFSRTFDWFLGRSVASGLQSVLDGKNQESASEDINFFYGMKTWGEVTKNSKLTALANLQLAIMRRAFNTYYLLTDANTVHPKQFIRNRVAGILFENKVDYNTFFSQLKEAIHMIQAIPTTPLMPFWRDLEFVQQEWTDSGPAGDPQISELAKTRSTGYRTLLYTQYAVLQPRQIANGIMADPNGTALDDGASLTWSLGFALSQLGKTGGK